MPLIHKKELVNDVYFINNPKFEIPQPTGRKALRSEEVYNQVVLVDGIRFDADEMSMDRIDRVLTIANTKFNTAIASGILSSQAYQQIYLTEIPWKTADDTLVYVTVELISKVQEHAVNNMAQIWTKYK